MKIKTVSFFLLITMIVPSCNISALKNEEMKKNVLELVKKINSWYAQGVIIKGFQPEENWYYYSKNDNTFTYPRNTNGYRKHVKSRLADITDAGYLTEAYLDNITPRFKNNSEIVNEGILFTDNELGDCITSILVETYNMDYLVSEFPSQNPFIEHNDGMSEEDIMEWHKERIYIKNSKKAIYKVMYSEVGYQDTDRANNYFIIEFVNEDNTWKINDIRIEETTEEEISEFYNANVKRRGYFED